jgi:hypothetical protein
MKDKRAGKETHERQKSRRERYEKGKNKRAGERDMKREKTKEQEREI